MTARGMWPVYRTKPDRASMHVIDRRREPGFRCDLADVAQITGAVCLSSTMGLLGLGEISWLPVYVTGIFFVFCNVTRIGRVQEVTWAVVAVLACAAAAYLETPFWPTVLGVTLPAAAVVIAWAYRVGRYSGVFAPPRA